MRKKENIMRTPYVYREGGRLTVKPFALNSFNRRVSKAGRSLVVNRDAEKLWLKFGGISARDEVPKSFVMVPLMGGKELVGGISIQDFENENAFEYFSIGLLESIASNIGTAILNVRLFEETQRLLKETEQRAQELAEQHRPWLQRRRDQQLVCLALLLAGKRPRSVARRH